MLRLFIPCSKMKNIIKRLQSFGKVIGQFVVKVVLVIVYFLVVGAYSIFIRFQHGTVKREHKFSKSDAENMF